jgi:opacity protein-like surface antigen
MRLRYALLASAAALSVTATAEAGHFNGWYAGLEGGANWIADEDALYVQSVISVFVTSAVDEASFDTGWAVFATAGYGFASGWRIEGEAGYRSNSVNARWPISDSIRTLDADVDEFSLMANVRYDARLGERLALSLGAGAGADHAELDGHFANFAGFTDPVSDDEWNFAVQGIAGMSYALSRRTELTLTYRYFHVFDPSFSERDVNSIFTFDETVSFDKFSKHSLTLGLRYDLWPDEVPVAPPPPPLPPPPPPPPAVKQFIIFFGFDKCSITEEADRVLGEAAGTAKSTGAAAIKIVGHTDTSGSAAYNQQLSDCRAGAAKSNLVGKGIPEGAISTSGRGETELMVQTGDGVKEPQNRRATVDLQ